MNIKSTFYFLRSASSAKSRAVVIFAASSVLVPIAAHAQTSPISGIYTGGAGTYTVNGTVTGILNSTTTANTFVVADGSGSVITYNIPKTTYTATVGDNLTLTSTNTVYQGSPELTSTSFSFTLNSSGNKVTVPSLTIPQFIAAGNGSTAQTANPPYAEALVTLSNVFLPAGTTTLATKTTYALTDAAGDTTNMYTYTTDSAVATGVTNANAAETASGNTLYAGPVNITGYVDVYYGVPEIYPTSITAAVPEPSSYVLMSFGGLGLMLVARRSRRAKLT